MKNRKVAKTASCKDDACSWDCAVSLSEERKITLYVEELAESRLECNMEDCNKEDS
jgi:hypothetical protein